MNGDGTDDFIMVDSILQNENRQAPTPADLQRWADGQLPSYGVNGWAAGPHEFPVVGDGDGSIWNQWYPSGSGSIPANGIIGADYVVDYFDAGWDETAARCCVEKNLCEVMPAGFVIPSTGTNCSQTFDCRSGGTPICTN